MRSWMFLLLLAAAVGCRDRPTGQRSPSPDRPSTAPTALPPTAPSPTAEAGESKDPTDGKFTLAEATAGLPGPAKGPLEAVIEIERGGQPLGAFHCTLLADKAPLAVANFVGLARGLRPFRDPRSGQWVKRPFYDGIYVHRVVPEFMIQLGDPNCYGDPNCGGVAGTGDPGYSFADEVEGGLPLHAGGLLAMANRGPHTNGSQVFITERATPWLTGHHTVFGRCAEVDLVSKISNVPRGPRDMPREPILVKKVTIWRRAG